MKSGEYQFQNEGHREKRKSRGGKDKKITGRAADKENLQELSEMKHLKTRIQELER